MLRSLWINLVGRSPRRLWPLWKNRLLIGWLAAGLVVTGCSLSEATPTPEPLPGATTSLPATDVPLLAPTEARQLVIWLPPFTGVDRDGQTGAVLDDAFFQFEQVHPGVTVDVHVKAESGPAGMATFLRSAQQVAPSILPDLVLIRTQQLWQLVDLGLVPPLEADEFSAADDFYGVGMEAVRYREQVYGISFSADVLALVYAAEGGGVAPRTWDEFLAQDRSLLFAAGVSESGPNLTALLQYVAAGGELREDGGFATPDALEEWFEFLATAQAQGLIDPRSMELLTPDAVWRAYAEQPQGVALVLAGDALSQPSLFAELALAQVPTQGGQTMALGPTWALALLTTDPEQRRLAVELAEAMLAPEVHGLWSRLAHRPPTRRGALATWTSGDGDVGLLGTLLEGAVALPNGRAFTEFARRVQVAQLSILREEATVADAIQVVRAGD